MKIIDVEGIGPVFADKLRSAGVVTTDDLLASGATPAGRKAIAEASGISSARILEWTNHADLMRINGVGSEYADLLEAAGVDTVPELARRNAANLATTFQELDAARPNLVRRVPGEGTVTGWIAQAQALGRTIEY
jgi:predicted flap endonuclease-1-like 5' DNA nuclease